MEIRALRYFLTVSREGNITKAAEALHVSQPTLSRCEHNVRPVLLRDNIVQRVRICFLAEEIDFVHGLCPEVIRKSPRLLLHCTKCAFNLDSIAVQSDDVRGTFTGAC